MLTSMPSCNKDGDIQWWLRNTYSHDINRLLSWIYNYCDHPVNNNHNSSSLSYYNSYRSKCSDSIRFPEPSWRTRCSSSNDFLYYGMLTFDFGLLALMKNAHESIVMQRYGSDLFYRLHRHTGSDLDLDCYCRSIHIHSNLHNILVGDIAVLAYSLQSARITTWVNRFSQG